ncbi:transcriptional Regulator, GntR family [Afipia carboxidovorans OM5]|uniref:Transcriptional regulator, GntR family protein n=1 Tax=Afipia carboxidovorans (strain ATCC 49405 / DSM 1227 / KCTC 32145 / OM5) TaxID=504832 RepID=B6JJ72_AFIC5|nr:GntR family transcriptional regulator [Afipia carboxidovorans]ACI94466.1 transcriptional Regulator, GntR family [Afipia carboxidovorans OM5]AEI01903.1 transcriptional regulator, GntR family protein [Afipia carboxidovorans OM4]AEI05478.1 transcriptional regulator, GntR family protein [Afipia carboxidovorans OM5]BEV46243.1 GntR family transcriptional regulator [Afipia carboxidovorans]
MTDASNLRPASTVSWLVETLRESILSGALPAHNVIRQDEIAEQHGVSRTPVREAIRLLEAEGLVISRPNRSAVVAPLDPEDAIEIFEIRAAMEALALRRSIPRFTEEHKEVAIQALEALEEVRHDASTEAHKAFHLALYAAAGSRLLRLISQHIDAAGRYLRVEATLAGTMDEDRYEHRSLLEAVLANDVPGATRLIERHLRSTGLEVAEVLRNKNPHRQDQRQMARLRINARTPS